MNSFELRSAIVKTTDATIQKLKSHQLAICLKKIYIKKEKTSERKININKGCDKRKDNKQTKRKRQKKGK